MKSYFAIAAAALVLSLAAPYTQADTVAAEASRALPVKNLDVFFDPPTGFVFIKMPAGWKFVGKMEASQVAEMSAHVMTSLLAPEEADVRMAANAAMPKQ